MYIDSRIKFMAKHLTVTINVQFIHYQCSHIMEKAFMYRLPNPYYVLCIIKLCSFSVSVENILRSILDSLRPQGGST